MAERIIFEHFGEVLYEFVTDKYVPTCTIERTAWWLAKRDKVRYRDIVIRVEKVGEDDEL